MPSGRSGIATPLTWSARPALTSAAAAWPRGWWSCGRVTCLRRSARFHLWWQEERSVEIKGSWEGLTRLREWVFGAQAHTRKGYVEAGDARLLRQIARVHAHLVLADGSCEPILAAAAEADGRQDFLRRLDALTTGA
jgi:hypothetical protein